MNVKSYQEKLLAKYEFKCTLLLILPIIYTIILDKIMSLTTMREIKYLNEGKNNELDWWDLSKSCYNDDNDDSGGWTGYHTNVSVKMP